MKGITWSLDIGIGYGWAVSLSFILLQHRIWRKTWHSKMFLMRKSLHASHPWTSRRSCDILSHPISYRTEIRPTISRHSHQLPIIQIITRHRTTSPYTSYHLRVPRSTGKPYIPRFTLATRELLHPSKTPHLIGPPQRATETQPPM